MGGGILGLAFARNHCSWLRYRRVSCFPLAFAKHISLVRRHVFQKPQAFEPERLWIDRLINVTVGRLDVVSARGAEGCHRTSPRTPVTPGAVPAAFLLVGAE